MNTKTLDQIKMSITVKLEHRNETGLSENLRLCALALRYEVPEKN